MNKIISTKEISEKKLIGGKAKGLLFLKENDFRVPEFYVLDFNTVAKIIKGEIELSKLINDWVVNNAIDPNTIWAVRSSANIEDGKKKSYAGLFKTATNISLSNLQEAIKQVLDAYTGFKSTKYDYRKNIQFAVIIQKMIISEYSGVAFSHNPNNLNERNIFLNLIPGLGEYLVSGKEEALSLKLQNRRTISLSKNKTYKGWINNGSLKNIEIQAEAFKRQLSPFIKHISKGVRKLSKLKKHPVDIEFTIADEIIYWLQVRPITTSFQKQVWDNSNIGDNYPDQTLPLSISFVKYTYLNAYSAMAEFLGMRKSMVKKNKPLFENMVGGIDGRLYYNVTNWQKLLYQLPFGKKTSRHITSIWSMEGVEFEYLPRSFSPLAYVKLFSNILFSFIFFGKHKRKFESIYKKVLNQYEKKDFSLLSFTELVTEFKKINKELGVQWIVPVLNGFFAFLLFTLLKKVFAKSRLNQEYPNFINDILYSQGDVISVEIVRQFQEIVHDILINKELIKLFNNQSEAFIANTLNSNYKSLNSKIENYIDKFGERCGGGELKIETINYKENPLLFIKLLKDNATGTLQTKKKENKVFNYKMILSEKYKYNPIKHFLLLGLIKKTLKRVRDRENYRFYRTKSFAIVRKIFRAIDKKLFTENKIDLTWDSNYLKINELMDIQQHENLKKFIQKRKEEYLGFNQKRKVNRYIQLDNKFIPSETKKLDNIKGEVKGIGCSSGLITNEVVIITNNKISQQDITGKILVAHYFEPGWINLFFSAAGVISERGSLLSHTAILCREMGIPAIVGAKGILSAVNNGSIVQMDGAQGWVKIK